MMKLFSGKMSCTVLMVAALHGGVATSLTQADVFVIHGIPGQDLGLDPALPVDVEVNGGCALTGFTFGAIVGPLALDAGSYDIEISLANAESPCGNDPVIEAAGVELVAGENYTIIAHLTEDGAPTASVFVNDVMPTNGDSRVIVHHTAAAPTVDVLLKKGWPWWVAALRVEDLSNGDQAAAVVDPGNYRASVVLPDRYSPLFGPIPLSLDADVVYLVYAVGSLTNGTFTLLLQTVEAGMPQATVYVLHGIPGEDLGLEPGLPVDVSVNGACALTGFMFGEFAGPVSLDGGTYDLAISLANPDDPCSEDPVIEAMDVELMSGMTYSIVAHLTEDGAPTASVFETDLATEKPGSRIVVHHTAAAPAVDVKLDRRWLRWTKPLWIEDLANGAQASADLLPGMWKAWLFPAGQMEPVFGPVSLKVRPNTIYLVFAVGSLQDGTFDLLVEPITAD